MAPFGAQEQEVIFRIEFSGIGEIGAHTGSLLVEIDSKTYLRLVCGVNSADNNSNLLIIIIVIY